jgi:hypothetical protein
VKEVIMFKRILLPAFGLCLAFAIPARAETTQFVCKSEDAANAIGAALLESTDTANEVAEPLLAMGECHYLDEKMFVYVVHRGTTYGDESKFMVVGFSEKMGEFPDMWGLISTNELQGDGTI